MRYWPILLLGLLQLPTPAQGGAWLREKGLPVFPWLDR